MAVLAKDVGRSLIEALVLAVLATGFIGGGVAAMLSAALRASDQGQIAASVGVLMIGTSGWSPVRGRVGWSISGALAMVAFGTVLTARCLVGGGWVAVVPTPYLNRPGIWIIVIGIVTGAAALVRMKWFAVSSAPEPHTQV